MSGVRSSCAASATKLRCAASARVETAEQRVQRVDQRLHLARPAGGRERRELARRSARDRGGDPLERRQRPRDREPEQEADQRRRDQPRHDGPTARGWRRARCAPTAAARPAPVRRRPARCRRARDRRACRRWRNRARRGPAPRARPANDRPARRRGSTPGRPAGCRGRRRAARRSPPAACRSPTPPAASAARRTARWPRRGRGDRWRRWRRRARAPALRPGAAAARVGSRSSCGEGDRATRSGGRRGGTGQHPPQAAHVADRVGRQLAPQRRKVHFDRVAVDRVLPSVEPFLELRARQDRAGTRRQRLEQRVFAPRKRRPSRRRPAPRAWRDRSSPRRGRCAGQLDRCAGAKAPGCAPRVRSARTA